VPWCFRLRASRTEISASPRAHAHLKRGRRRVQNANALLLKLRDVIVKVMESSRVVTTSSLNITEAAQSLSQSANEQSTSVEEITTSMEEMSSMISQNAQTREKPMRSRGSRPTRRLRGAKQSLRPSNRCGRSARG